MNGINGKSKLLALILSAALAFSLCGCAAVTKMVSPEAYMKQAWQKTGRGMDRGAPSMAGFNRFQDGPFEQLLAVGVSDTNVEAARMFLGAAITAATKTDYEAAKMLSDITVGYNGIMLPGNQLFISKDMVAAAVPFVYDEHSYVTAVPATFTQDWNGSALAGLWGAVPEDFDLRAYIEAMFEANRATAELDPAEYAARIKEMNNRLLEGSALAKGEAETLTIGGREVKADRFTYTVPVSALNEYYGSLKAMVLEPLAEYAAIYAKIGADESFTAIHDETAKLLDGVAFTSDMTMDVYVDNRQLVNKIELSGLNVTAAPPQGGDAWEGVLAADLTYTGGEDASYVGGTHIFSNAVFNVSLAGVGGEYKFTLTTTDSSDAGTLNQKAFATLENAGGDTVRASVDVAWDTAVTDGDNLNALMALSTGGSDVALTLTGALADKPEEVSLKNGKLRLEDKTTGDYLEFILDISMLAAAAEDIAIDESDARSIYEFTINEIFSIFQNLYAGMEAQQAGQEPAQH